MSSRLSFNAPSALRGLALLTLCLAGAACGAASDTVDPSSTSASMEKTTTGAPLPVGAGDPAVPTAPEGNLTASSGSTGAAATPMPFRGVNLAGGEFGDVLPGTEGRDYRWPTHDEVDYYLSKGMNTFRVGFKWERLQPTANGELEPAYLAKLDALVAYATTQGAHVILNPHNFARYRGVPVGSAEVPATVFADLWRRLALRYGPNAAIMFNLVNEPHDMPTEQWVASANAAIAAIRAAGATNMIHVPGNSWTGAHSWAHTSSYGTPNAVAMLDIVDPADNMVFEVHQYLDTSSGGTSDQCVSETIGSERMATFVDWLRKHGKKGFVGEFAGGRNPTCDAAVKDMLGSLMSASDVIVGWQWWAAGPGWGSYPFSLEPTNGQDQPQMSLLLPYLKKT